MLEKTHDMCLKNKNKNTEFEEGWQNVMGFSCMKAVYEYTRYLHSRKILLFYPTFTRKKSSKPATNTIKK